MWSDHYTFDPATCVFTYPNKMKLDRTANSNLQSAVLLDWGVDVNAPLHEGSTSLHKEVNKTGEEQKRTQMIKENVIQMT